MEAAPDQALELADGDAGAGGELARRQGLVEMGLHVGDDAGDAAVDRGDVAADRHPLRLEARALALVDQAGRTTSARSWPCLVRISSSIRSSVAMPPAQVSRLRSLKNSCSTTSISGWRSWNSCTASQCSVIE